MYKTPRSLCESDYLHVDIHVHRCLHGSHLSFVNKDFQLETVTLQTDRFPQTHTSAHIATELERTISDWGIKGKVICLSANNVANVKAAVELLRPKVTYIPCFTHTINLIVKRGLENVPDIRVMSPDSRGFQIILYCKQNDIHAEYTTKTCS
jgi:hypothetical protein